MTEKPPFLLLPTKFRCKAYCAVFELAHLPGMYPSYDEEAAFCPTSLLPKIDGLPAAFPG